MNPLAATAVYSCLRFEQNNTKVPWPSKLQSDFAEKTLGTVDFGEVKETKLHITNLPPTWKSLTKHTIFDYCSVYQDPSTNERALYLTEYRTAQKVSTRSGKIKQPVYSLETKVLPKQTKPKKSILSNVLTKVNNEKNESSEKIVSTEDSKKWNFKSIALSSVLMEVKTPETIISFPDDNVTESSNPSTGNPTVNTSTQNLISFPITTPNTSEENSILPSISPSNNLTLTEEEVQAIVDENSS